MLPCADWGSDHRLMLHILHYTIILNALQLYQCSICHSPLFLLHSSYRSISLTEHTIHHYPSLAIQAWEG